MVFSNYFVLTFLLTFLAKISLNASTPTVQPLKVQSHFAETRWAFDKLLNSIANVNKERLDALKRYTELDNYNPADGTLRVSGDRDPMVAVLFLNKNNPTTNKLYEIYDSDLKIAQDDTPVRDIVQQIKEFYDEALENDKSEDVIGIEDDDILKKIHGTNLHIERDGKEPSDGEEIIPSKNNTQAREINNKEPDDGEEIGNKRGRTVPTKETAKEEEIIVGKEKLKLTIDTAQNKKQILRLFKSCNKKALRTCKKACKAASKRVCESYRCSKSMKKAYKIHCARECKSKFYE